jgi:ABC-type maltose transport system permease subunit
MHAKTNGLLARHLLLIAIILLVLFPVLYVISISLNPTGSIGSNLIPDKFSLNH